MSRRSTIEFTPADLAAIASACKIVQAKYRGYVDFEDLQSECYVWLLANYKRVEEWREEYSEKHAERTVLKGLRNAAERYARREKAAFEGYKPDDEFFYSIPMVADMLKLYFDPERFAVPAQVLGQTSSGKPASEGGNLMAMVADVGRAYEALPAHDRQLLFWVYGSGVQAENIQALANEWEVTFSAANMRVRRIVGRVRAQLGGGSPYDGSDEE